MTQKTPETNANTASVLRPPHWHSTTHPLQVSRLDRVENGEQRWQTLGMTGDVVLLLVAHTWHEAENGTEHIRIISTRRATQLERKIYEQNT